MGKRRRRSSRDIFWTQQYGGMPVWGLAAAMAFLAIAAAVAIPAALSQPEPAEAREPRPVPTMVQPEKKPLAVFIGDSYTAGAGGTKGGFAPIVAADQGWRMENLGRGGTGFLIQDLDADLAQQACGADYCEAYPEMITEAAGMSPDVVVVSGGRNNAGDAGADVREAIDEFFASLRAELPDARVIVTSPVWDDDEAPAMLADIAGWEKSAARDIGAEFP